MKKIILLLIVALAVTFTACDKTNSDSDAVRSFQKTTDLAALSQRLQVVNEPIQWTGLKSSTLSPVSYNLAWTLQSLVLGGTDTLSASCVEVDGNYCYVGFHNYGPSFGGEIATVAVSGPTLFQSDVDPFADYNDMEIDRFKANLWVAGENNGRGAIILQVPLTPTGVPTVGPVLEMPIYGASGNSITYVTNLAYTELWVSSGRTGGLLVLDATAPSNILYQADLANAKQFDATGDYGVLLYGVSATESKIRVFDIAHVYNYIEYSIPFSVTTLGKNAVDISQEYVYLAMGADGVVKVNMLTGAVVAVFDFNGFGLANGVKVDGTYVYVANGADGFFLLDKVDLSVVGHWDGIGSCNYVDVQDGVVYLANGVGGLYVLERI
jgi:hypothetical protein